MMNDIERYINSLKRVGLFEAYLVENGKEYIFSDNKFLERDVKKKSRPISTKSIRPPVPHMKKKAIAVEQEKYAWKVAQIMNTTLSYKEYVEKYPGGIYVKEARDKIKEFKEDEASWEESKKKNSIQSYKSYLEKHPEGLFSSQAETKIKDLKGEGKAWEVAKRINTIDSYEKYLKKFPEGQNVNEAILMIKNISDDQKAWQFAAGMNTLESYKEYLAEYSDGLFAVQANKRIKKLVEQESQEKEKRIKEKRKDTKEFLESESEEDISPSIYIERHISKTIYRVALLVIALVAVTYMIMHFSGNKSIPDNKGTNSFGKGYPLEKKSEIKRDEFKPGSFDTKTTEESAKEERIPPAQNMIAAKEKDNRKGKTVIIQKEQKHNGKDIQQKKEGISKKGEEPELIKDDIIKVEKARTTPLEQTTKKKETIQQVDEVKYKDNFNQAKIYYQAGLFDQALENVNKALQIKKSDELDKLEQEIKEQKRKTQEKKEIRSVKLSNVLKYLSQNYYESIKHLEIQNVNPQIKVGGQVFVKLNISEKGRVSIQTFNDSRLKVTPEGQKNIITNLIQKTISSVAVAPPKDKSGETVKVEGWPLTFEVGKFRDKIVLNIIF